MFIFQIDATKVTGPESNKGISPLATNPDSVLLKTLSQTADINPIDPPPLSPGMLLGKIMDLSNEYMIYAQQHSGPPTRVNDDGSITQNIMPAPPWENSNELFEALAQYTGIPVSEEKGNAEKSFFYSIMNKMPQDPNNDRVQDYKDVLSIWGNSSVESVTKGDINGDGKIDQADVKILKYALAFGDMNHDGKLDAEDHRLLEEYLGITPLPTIHPHVPGEWGDVNYDASVDEKDLRLLEQVIKAGDMNNDGKVDKEDVQLLRNQIGLPPEVELPHRVGIDLNNDGTFDYMIYGGIIFAKGKEVDSIPGVDLKELSDKIKQNLGGKPGGEFYNDINGDGKIDHIAADSRY